MSETGQEQPGQTQEVVLVLQEYRRQLVQTDFETSRDISKSLSFLAGGAIGVSLAFIETLKGLDQCKSLIVTAWINFAISLVGNFLSLLLSGIGQRKLIGIIDSAPDIRTVNDALNHSVWFKFTRVAGYIAIATFFLGLVSMLTYVIALL